MIIKARPADIGGFSVRRILPYRARRSVGAFIFLDHMGPARLGPGHGMDVAPHPHINLATVTYLFEGEILHRDSLGSEQAIRPGEINWMTAGTGVVHSERTAAELRAQDMTVHGLQAWVGLPVEQEEVAPDFTHYPAAALPSVERDGCQFRVLIGHGYAARSPVATHSELFYIDAQIPAGARLPLDVDYPERALYVVSGRLRCDGDPVAEGELLVIDDNQPAITADEDTRLVMLGGEPLDGEPRHMWWNFVSSSRDRLDQAKADWAKGPGASTRFPKVPGDEDEFVALPE